MTNALDQLRALSVVVADTADFVAIEQFKPVDATTNPSLILKQAQSPVTEGLIIETKQKLKMDQPDILVRPPHDPIRVLDFMKAERILNNAESLRAVTRDHPKKLTKEPMEVT